MNNASGAVEAALAQFEGLYPDKIELSLGRINAVLETLGRPQDKLPPIIHVAGTNGKGSTCAFIRAMAEAAGLKVHVFTSPHLVRFNERIRLAGKLVEDAPLTDWLSRTYEALGGHPITHFEATTAAALLAFSEVPADLLVLEVGLGGRFDATNVIGVPAVSVITPVDHDHKAFLGTDLTRIAWEKAGIIKPGAPVVSAIQSHLVGDVIRDEATRTGAKLTRLTSAMIDRLPDILALKGAHQRANAALAALALDVWGNDRITPDAIETGAQQAVWPARMQRLAQGAVTNLAGSAEIWLDGGHNPHAARAVAALLGDMSDPSGGETILVCAMMASKDARGFFEAFADLRPRVITVPNAGGHSGADPENLVQAAHDAGLEAESAEDFMAGVICATRYKPARILICGSLYLAGDVLEQNGELLD